VKYTTLGKTGLQVSVAGLGCGGYSQLGLSRGKSENDAIAIVRAAIDLGVNFFDTAEAYSTEVVIGRALAGIPRERAVLCSKSRYRDMASGALHPTQKVLANLDESLRRMGVEYVDVFLIHGALPEHYEHILHELAPALLREKEKGKIRHIGLSEFPAKDPEHALLERALQDSLWEVIMLGFHMMHQSASAKVLPRAQAQSVGTVVMYAVRTIFSRPGALPQAMKELAAKGEVPAELASENPLGFLIHPGGATSLIDAAYRFARHEPGANVILFGTSDQQHLRANVESLLRPPLPSGDVERLRKLFSHLRGVGLDLPPGAGHAAAAARPS
jgi:aryl-alcohol dehydrogenase-like predicted oxidoreductase